MIVTPYSIPEPSGGSAACRQDVVSANSKQPARFSHARLLQDVKNIQKGSKSVVELPFASEILELWMRYCDLAGQPGCTQPGSRFSTDQLSCILQVASFLKDQRSLSDAAESMANLICQHLVRDESTDDAAHRSNVDTGTYTTPIPIIITF